ncbi:MAG: alanine racemase [Candidatus Sungiibacteriota bacterium]
MKDVRTWIEIDARALRHNAEQFFRLLPASTRLMAVIKSNAYGHGLVSTAKLLADIARNVRSRTSHKMKEEKIWFGVDSIVEALRLRHQGIKNPILVLGHTLPSRVVEAASRDITLTVSNFDALAALAGVRPRPAFHLKVDTGMHRQGFMPDDILRLIAAIKRKKLIPTAVYTHFASAKNTNDPSYTLFQFKQFRRIVSSFRQAGFQHLMCHAAASGATLLFPETHLDMVRVGMGLYGYWPSPEARINNKNKKIKVDLQPVLTWKTIIAEIKDIPAGAKIGYDETEAVKRKSRIAVLPIGYWHGYDRGLSSIGEVLIQGKRAKVLGRVSMDMIVIDATDIPKASVGDEVVLIGRQGKNTIFADELAAKINTTAYEFLTRINPLIRRVVV